VDALETDWATVLPPERCSYVLGNPPFGGSKYQTDKQREQVRRIARLSGSGGTLDYVSAWFIKAGEYVAASRARIAFVGTNSITQGEQVAQLWPVLFGRCGLEISFAHRTFAWGSDARGKAHVHVVIIGLCLRADEPTLKRLFTYDDIKGDPTESHHDSITAYLFDGSAIADRHLVVEETPKPLSGQPKLIIGTKPIDDGNYIFDAEQRKDFLRIETRASEYMFPFVGSEEFINGGERWILYLENAPAGDLRSMPELMKRIAAVKQFRKKSKSLGTQTLGDMPTKFHVTVVPNRPFLVIPEVSILTSRMHMAWLRYIGGRLESRYRYSIGIVYNPFPWPDADGKQRGRICDLAQAIIAARAKFPGATMADLYDSDVMKPELLHAHRSLDAAVDKLYRSEAFPGDRQRVEHLFTCYEKLVAPLTATRRPRRLPRAQ